MRLALISPPQPYLITHHTQVPLGLLYLSAAVKRDCPAWEVEVLDYSASPVEKAGDGIADYDVYGFTATTLDFTIAQMLRKRIAARWPNAKHIVGGPHVTAIPDDAAEFDAVFVGEAEARLVEYLNAGAQGVGVYRAAGPVDMGTLPYPDREALDWLGGRVLVREHGNSINIMASRGCPYRCAFCASQVMWPGPVRWRTPEAVIAEMRSCLEKYGVGVFRFSDDNMTSNPDWTHEFCRLVRPLDIRWRLSCRVDRVDDDLLEAMSAAGCEEMGLGIESFDQNVLDVLAKGQTVEQALTAVEKLYEAGIGARILLMVNTPGETLATIDRNIEALERLRGKFVYLSAKMFIPLPGTPIWDDPASFGIYIMSKELAHYNFYPYAAGAVDKPNAWSPIRIRGMSRHEQRHNAERMFAYMEPLPAAKAGRL